MLKHQKSINREIEKSNNLKSKRQKLKTEKSTNLKIVKLKYWKTMKSNLVILDRLQIFGYRPC